MAHNRKNEIDLAIIDYNKAIQFDPNNAGAYHNRGTAYHDIGEYDQTIKDYTSASSSVN